MKSIQSRIFFAFLGTSILLFGTTFLFSGWIAKNALTDLTERNLLLQAEQGAKVVENILEDPYRLVSASSQTARLFLRDLDAYSAEDLNRLESYFQREIDTSDAVLALWIQRASDGAIIVSSGETPEESLQHIEILSDKDFYLTEPVLSKEGTQKYRSSLLLGLRDDTDVLTGAVGALVDLSVLDLAISDLEEASGAVGTVTGESGLIISDSSPERIGQLLSSVQSPDAVSAASRAVGEGRTLAVQSAYPDPRGASYTQMISGVEVDDQYTGWIFIAGFSHALMEQPVAKVVWSMVLPGIAAICITAILLILVSGRITKPLKALNEDFRRIGSGDFQVRSTIQGRDETGQLAMEMNGFVDTLNESFLGIRHLIHDLRERGAVLSSEVQEAEHSFKQISDSITEVIMKGSDNTEGITKVSEAVANIVNNTRSLQDRLKRQSEDLLRSSSAIEELLRSIDSVTQKLFSSNKQFSDLSEASRIGEEKLSMVIERIEEINSRSAALLETNTLISGIASQTNLLSMNAAIEAAHAGEAGKGFAVVADEIRKLAENSSEQSKSTDTMLKQIVSGFGEITETSREAGDYFSSIRELVKQVVRVEAELQASMQEQSAGSKEVQRSLDSLKDSSREIEKDSALVASEAASIRESLSVLEENSHGISEHIIRVHEASQHLHSTVERAGKQAHENSDAAINAESELKRFHLVEDDEEDGDRRK